MSEIDDFLNRPFLARIATANPATLQPHVVPVWYAWDGASLWIHTFRATRKVRDLLKNPRLAVVVDSTEPFAGLTGVLLEGQAEFIDSPPELVEEKANWIYVRYLGEEGSKAPEPQSWIHDPQSTLLRLTPTWIKSWK